MCLLGGSGTHAWARSAARCRRDARAHVPSPAWPLGRLGSARRGGSAGCPSLPGKARSPCCVRPHAGGDRINTDMFLEGCDVEQVPAVEFEGRDSITDSLRYAWCCRFDGGPELLECPARNRRCLSYVVSNCRGLGHTISGLVAGWIAT